MWYRKIKESASAKKASWVYTWLEIKTDPRPEDISFERFEIKIFDTVYTEYSEEFKKLYKDALIWKRLNADV